MRQTDVTLTLEYEYVETEKEYTYSQRIRGAKVNTVEYVTYSTVEALHMQLKLQNASYRQKVEEWYSESDSDVGLSIGFF